jgi:hypothetical protein
VLENGDNFRGCFYVRDKDTVLVRVFGACLFRIGTLGSTMKTRGPAMFRIGLMALSAISLTCASAKAIDNAAAANAAAAFDQFGVAGLAVAGRAAAGYGYPPFGPSGHLSHDC